MDSSALMVVIFALGLLVVIVGYATLQSRARSERLTRQAEKRGGEIRRDAFWKQPELRIPFRDSILVVYTIPGSRYSPPRTVAQVKLDLPRLPILRMTRSTLMQKMLAAFGRESLLTADEDFDRRWVVQTEDVFAAQKLLTPEFKTQLDQRVFRTLVVDIRPQELSFTITTIPSNDEALDAFVEAALMVLNKFL